MVRERTGPPLIQGALGNLRMCYLSRGSVEEKKLAGQREARESVQVEAERCMKMSKKE